MARWGIFPEDSDESTKWFTELHEKTGLPKIIGETLSQENLMAHHEEIRAAAYMVSLLARSQMWPADDIDRHLELAKTRLEEMLESEEWVSIHSDNEDIVDRVQFEIDFLEEVLNPAEEEGEIGDEIDES